MNTRRRTSRRRIVLGLGLGLTTRIRTSARGLGSTRGGRRPRISALVGGVLLALLLAGCGEIKNTITPDPGRANKVTVELAGRPSAYDAGLYMAQALGYFRQTDMNVSFSSPPRGEDPLTLLHNGKVLIAVSSEPSVFLQRELNQPVVSVGALVQRPLSEIPVKVVKARRPSGVKRRHPSGTSRGARRHSRGTKSRHQSGGVSLGGTLRHRRRKHAHRLAEARAHAGAGRTTTPTATTSAAPTTTSAPTVATATTTTPTSTGADTSAGSGRGAGTTTPPPTSTQPSPAVTTPAIPTTTAAAPTTPTITTPGGIPSPPGTTTPTPAQVPSASTWPSVLPQLLSAPGAPAYDALVVVVRKGTIVDHAPLIRRFVQAAARGYRALRHHPRAAIADLIRANPRLAHERRQLLATLHATLPYLFPPRHIWGWQSEKQWNAFGSWLARHDLITNPNAIINASTNELLQGQGV